MDVKDLVTQKRRKSVDKGTIGSRQRRALARLGLATAGAYVAPTLLALRSTAQAPLPAEAGAAA
jgi:hypothetical protein